MRKITKIRRSIRAISPVISVLLMIAIAVVASLVAYAWIMGYIGGNTTKSGNAILIQNYVTGGNLIVYVQNTGQGTVHLKQDSSVYVNDVLKNILTADDKDVVDPPGQLIPITVGQTVKLVIDCPFNPGDRVKIVTVEGTSMTITGNSDSGNSGGSGGSGSGGSGGSGDSGSQVLVTFAVNPAGTGIVSPSGLQTITTGTIIQISALANGGFTFSSWTFTGSIQINNPTSAITTATINGAGTVTANFVSASNPKLVFTAGSSQSIYVNDMSSTITIQRQDTAGNAITTGSTSINLATTSSGGAFYSDSNGATQISSITVTNGASSANVWYKDSTVGAPTLTAATSDSSYSPVSTTFNINSLTPTPSPSPNPSSSPTPTPNPSSSPTPNPSSSPTPSPTPTTSPTPTPTNPPSQVQVTFAANPTAGGTVSPSGTQTFTTGASQQIIATHNSNYAFSSWTFSGSIQITNPTSASTNAVINGAGTVTANFIQTSTNKLVFTAGTSQTLLVNQPSSVITVQRQTSSGTPITSGTTTVTLTATSGVFYSDAYCTTLITSKTISSGSTASFYYKASATGTPTLTASATSYASVSTTFTINNPLSATVLPATTNFDGTPWDQGWNYWTNPPWNVATDHYFSSPQSVKTTQSNQGAFSCSPQDATGAKYITVTFEFMINQYTQPSNFQIRYGVTVTNDYNSVAWQNFGVNLGDTSVYSPNVWHQYTITIPNTLAFTTNFRFQFLSQGMSPTAAIWIDNIQVTMYK